jgi:N-acetyl-anhydromuramoyl-L-alanine amidase
MPEAKPGALWESGWYRYARRLESPNFGPRPEGAVIDLLVVHSISLPPGKYGNGDVQALFCNQLDWNAHPYYQTIRDLQVSAHFFVTRAGELWQFVSCDERAWHAGASCYRGLSNCNDHSIGIELEGVEGDPFDGRQYECLGALAAALATQYPIAHVAGHEHIAPGRKGDPGVGFDWQLFRRSLGWPAESFPAAA